MFKVGPRLLGEATAQQAADEKEKRLKDNRLVAAAAAASGALGLYNLRSHLRFPVPSFPDFRKINWHSLPC